MCCARWRRNRVAVLLAAMFVLVAGMAAAARHQLDEKGRIERALARGEAVTLIGATGMAKWHDWKVVPARLKGSLMNDGTAGFEANPCAGLVLVEDPQTNDYLFRADIRHEGGLHSVPGGLTRNDAGKVGLFWGAQKLGAADAAAHLLFTIDFNDLPWKTVQNPGADDGGHKVGFHLNCLHQEPNAYLRNSEIGNSAIRLFPFHEPSPPGAWRTIELEIRPTGCTARWKEISDGSFVHLGHFDAARMDSYLRSRLDLVAALPPGNRAWSPLAPWSPRQPLGVYSFNSNVAVRNAAVEPLAPQP